MLWPDLSPNAATLSIDVVAESATNGGLPLPQKLFEINTSGVLLPEWMLTQWFVPTQNADSSQVEQALAGSTAATATTATVTTASAAALAASPPAADQGDGNSTLAVIATASPQAAARSPAPKPVSGKSKKQSPAPIKALESSEAASGEVFAP
jgi:hypothetical protein